MIGIDPDVKPKLSHILGRISYHHAGAAHFIRLDRRMYKWSVQMELSWRGELEKWYPGSVSEAVPQIKPITQADIDRVKAQQASGEEMEDRWE